MDKGCIGKLGRIVSGKGAEQYVKIEDDAENTGGFLVLAKDI